MRTDQAVFRKTGSILLIKSSSMTTYLLHLYKNSVHLLVHIARSCVYCSKQFILSDKHLPVKLIIQSWIIKDTALHDIRNFLPSSVGVYVCPFFFAIFFIAAIHIFCFHIVVAFFERKESRNETINLDFWYGHDDNEGEKI